MNFQKQLIDQVNILNDRLETNDLESIERIRLTTWRDSKQTQLKHIK